MEKTRHGCPKEVSVFCLNGVHLGLEAYQENKQAPQILGMQIEVQITNTPEGSSHLLKPHDASCKQVVSGSSN